MLLHVDNIAQHNLLLFLLLTYLRSKIYRMDDLVSDTCLTFRQTIKVLLKTFVRGPNLLS